MKVSSRKLVFFKFFYFAFFLLGLIACEDHDNLKVPREIEVQDFVWKGMNLYYLWQQDVADLADERFSGQPQLNDYLSQFVNPRDLFQQLRTSPEIDRFSVIYSDYRVLEGVLSGTIKNNGVDFQLLYKPGSDTQIFGWVRYILPNSDAAGKDIQRGDIFYAVNGTPLTVSNYQELLSTDAYTLNLASYDSGNITPNGRQVSLVKSVLSENPVYLTRIIDTGSHKVGYLMYNAFYGAFDGQLNEAFGQLKQANVTDLVLDLRYNSGGSIASATRLASMITGQFTGQIFASQRWNEKAQEYLESLSAESLRNRFTTTLANGTPLQSLYMTRVFVLTTASTASASELLIHFLEPYVQVIQIGTTTVGKNVGSITLYDSPNFQKENVNPRHRYAMQPIVVKTVNKNGFGDYTTGLAPDVVQPEDLANLGELGNPTEPLLETAIAIITGSGRPAHRSQMMFSLVSDSKTLSGQSGMYVDKQP
ncbi:MAG TPA: S41 family peptidase [Flavobacterium sp.]|nr:S41 family peptidase [Flavobacterium sp.]